MAQKQKGVADAMIEADRWTSDGEGSSLLDSPFLPDVRSYTLSQKNLSNISKLKIYHLNPGESEFALFYEKSGLTESGWPKGHEF